MNDRLRCYRQSDIQHPCGGSGFQDVVRMEKVRAERSKENTKIEGNEEDIDGTRWRGRDIHNVYIYISYYG